MGMYNYVRFECECPRCGSGVNGFQTKDGDLSLSLVEAGDVDNFYAPCYGCGAWLEVDRIDEGYRVTAFRAEAEVGQSVIKIETTK